MIQNLYTTTKSKYNNTIPLIAISIAAGACTYFTLPTEPNKTIILYLIAIIIFGLVVRPYGSKISICLITFSIEIIIATFRTQYIATNNIIHKKIFISDCYAKISNIDHYHNHKKIIIKIINNTDPKIPKRARITIRQKIEQLKIGDTIKASIMLLPPQPNNYPGSYNFRMFAYFSGIGAVGYTTNTPTRIDYNKHSSIVNQLREKISNHLHATMPKETAAIASTLVVGKKSRVDHKTKEVINKAGLSHLLAISGLHMAMISTFSFYCIRTIMSFSIFLSVTCNTKKFSALLSAIISLIYLALSGNSISAQRAFTVSLLFYIAIIFDRCSNGKNSTMLSAIVILLITPESLLHPSFQLSFAAVCAILTTHNILSNYTKNIFIKPIKTLINSTTITIATAPYLIYHFNQISISGIFANILAIPLTSFVIMPAVMSTVLLGWFSVLSNTTAYIAHISIMMLIKIAKYNSGWGIIKLPDMPTSSMTIASIAIIWIFITNKLNKIYAIIPFITAILLWINNEKPDILLYGNNIVANVENNEKPLLIKGKVNSYTITTWSQKLATSFKHIKIKSLENQCGVCYFKKGNSILITTQNTVPNHCTADIIVNITKQKIQTDSKIIYYKFQPIFIYINHMSPIIKTYSSQQRPWSLLAKR
ncbi:competence protein ComEC [Candidatus Xenohaliotis californiensis]|uniref:Competence protein ComEC n=1 Tax=Candidatus Xenohaliotis californiensis TaxID=84677 RepID=A0ABM9N909_9RICK|nr:competence protein ComEC [Candidatus Xenohaliotis californiensis]